MNELLQQIQTLLVRDLRGFIAEIEAWPDDELVWKTPDSISNSAGILAMHAAGNLNHYVGHVLGGTQYVRDRNLEFTNRSLSRTEICRELSATISMLESILPSIDPARLPEFFSEPVGGHLINTQAFLVHLCTHLSFHLGQVGYLRRMMTENNQSTNPLPVSVFSLNENRD